MPRKRHTAEEIVTKQHIEFGEGVVDPRASAVWNRDGIGRDRPQGRSASGAGGCGSSTTSTTPSSWSSPRAAKPCRWPSWANTVPTSGSRTATAPSWDGRPRRTRSASPISSATCNTISTQATASLHLGCGICSGAPAGSARPKTTVQSAYVYLNSLLCRFNSLFAAI